jgi:coenzyme PQQ synthesis protein D (PqqD)
VVQEINAGRAPDEIAPRLAERFAGAEGAIESEVKAFLAELRDKGLVEG